ncbi:S8 family serine peptidase [Nostocaceae cyanobacterium CENA357]|uniref:S8 family serine peptidase n=1 Tax=Atlanticothrix silvestris CENA357 TaxID=1725252 RepID=A0A8J7HKU6_9CYAN|nr:S8 family peptidase [Atlanticothrix silvestris]MBH8554929.1 S8 family serine peptidase [Atlanticothrix silvestris CENA357]
MLNKQTDNFSASLNNSFQSLTAQIARNPFDFDSSINTYRNASSFLSELFNNRKSIVFGSDSTTDTYNFDSQYLGKPNNWFDNSITNKFAINCNQKIIDYNTGQVIDDSNKEFNTNSYLANFLANNNDIQPNNPNFGNTELTQLNRDTYSIEPALTVQSYQFSEVYGYGLVNAAAAVAQSIGQSPFIDVANQSSYYDWGLDAISAPEVWTQGYTGNNIVVAVVDTGVDYTHTDLNNNIWLNSDEIFGNGIDDDGNGYADDVVGWNFVDNNYNPMDYQGHGTHVAGIIAAENDGYGTIGVAPNAKIMPIQVLDANGIGSSDNVSSGIIYAANNGANVINVSLGGSYSPSIEQAIQYATQRGAVVVMAAGNEAASQPTYPAALATNWGIAVGAIDYNGYMGNFSNLAGNNSNLSYVVAPGVDIYSTVPGNNYEFKNGTSMATPYVSGVAALMLSANPYLTPDQVRQIIVETA